MGTLLQHVDMPTLIAATLAAISIGLAKGGLQSAGMLAVPILSLAMPTMAAAAMLLPIFIISDVFGVWAFRRSYDAWNLRVLIPSALAGVVIGWLTASVVSAAAVNLIVGGLGLAYCASSALKAWAGAALASRAPASVAAGWCWGVLSGFTSFVSHAGAPAFQIFVLPQRLAPMAYAGTAAILFAVVNAAKLAPYWALGEFDVLRPEALAVVPVAIASTFLGVHLVKTLPTRLFFRIVETLLLLVSLKLVLDGAGL
ncbi:sulfite exporter TauE/SafE family protein [Ancylobacter sp. VNQ12]|uniref:sulfite exporter TauE/SafE family protein n=1 Tax=Ancylobacter sp. VNQ12 TaxID=3400920 RepID=UPI003C111830